jgi:hypothetical protein
MISTALLTSADSVPGAPSLPNSSMKVAFAPFSEDDQVWLKAERSAPSSRVVTDGFLNLNPAGT